MSGSLTTASPHSFNYRNIQTNIGKQFYQTTSSPPSMKSFRGHHLHHPAHILDSKCQVKPQSTMLLSYKVTILTWLGHSQQTHSDLDHVDNGRYVRYSWMDEGMRSSVTYSDIKKTLVCWFVVNLSDLSSWVWPKRRSKVYARLSCLVELLEDLVAEGLEGL